MSTEIIRPNADSATGSSSDCWEKYPSATVSKFQCVDETTHNDLTDYLTNDTDPNGGYTCFSFPNPTSSRISKINSIKVYFCILTAGIDNSPDNVDYILPFVYIGSSRYSGTRRESKAAWTTYSETWTTNPKTGLAWTWTELDAILAGIGAVNDDEGNAERKCTQLYISIDYTAFSIPTVTSQAVSDILSTTATGNGNITATGGINATKRGVCWNTTGSPTTADDKVEASGDFGTGAFTADLTELSPGVKYYVKAYAINEAGTSYGAEVNFTTDKVAPTVTTQSPTDVLATTVTANGNITALGGENATVRGFQYGLTQVDTWDAHDDGSFSAGAYTKAITSNLVANTTYWIRAYATNSIGTSYGAWVQFQTAAVGTIPTGTKLDICSDYSGYTYQLQRSETDDGSAYTAYFVISTDLSNKSALAFYKRILDLHLYFNSVASGTATVEVKRDNEAVWQAVGSVALTGTADIIIKHLATRIYGKHFLFKISAANKFEFLGCLFQFVPGGMR